MPEHVRFSANNLLWACSEYESVGDDVAELRRLAAERRAALEGSGRPGPVRVGSCPAVVEGAECGEVLTATADSLRIRCRSCGTGHEIKSFKIDQINGNTAHVTYAFDDAPLLDQEQQPWIREHDTYSRWKYDDC
ncbi:hypothetical protein ACH4E8_14180 [Streptomyces sp. NPDC017979]|uniref:hypothetical protein n=1 Tax=Streptomyces sp. NPDC017979 TaxID=3365024 RepID=UPI00378C6D6C